LKNNLGILEGVFPQLAEKQRKRRKITKKFVKEKRSPNCLITMFILGRIEA
jgi:type II secretory pathway component PulF